MPVSSAACTTNTKIGRWRQREGSTSSDVATAYSENKIGREEAAGTFGNSSEATSRPQAADKARVRSILV